VNFFNSVSGPRSRNDGKSRRPLWPLVPFLLLPIVFFGRRAVVEKDSASRQRTSFGTLLECNQRGRGNENYCHYMFYVGEEPRVSALEDFSERSRTSMRFLYFFVVTLAVTSALILWDRSPRRL
jgi:hypothetical protein